MLKNYIKTAWRSLQRNKVTAFISVFGLMVGVACFFLLATYILNELRYDRFHEKADRIVFINYNYKSPSDAEAMHVAVTPTAVVPVSKREFSEVENGVRLVEYKNKVIDVGDQAFTEKKLWLADDAFFTIFSYHFLEGNPVSALKNPNSLVINQSIAKKYFGEEPALGKIVKIDSTGWQITGVIEDAPPYSSIKFDIMGSYNTLERSKTEKWNSANDVSFLLLKKPGTQNQVQQKLNAHVARQFPQEVKAGYKMWFELEPLARVHLYSKAAAQGNITYLYILGGVALLLLVIACINFTNLFTAKSADRAKEIGVRKVLGAERKTLFFQFITESAIVTFAAMGAGLLLSYLVFPVFNRITELELSLATWNASYLVGILLILFIVITFLSGAWPALVISGFRPVLALKPGGTTRGNSGGLRKFLVVFQFTISIIFIIATLVAQKQLHFIQHTDTGINRSQVVVLDAGNMPQQQLDALKAELLKSRSVKSVTASYDSPVNIQGGYSLSVAGREDNNALSITAIPVDKDFVSALELKIIQGSNFTYADEQQVKVSDYEKRNYAFMLNQTAVKTLGFTPQEAVGKKVSLNGRNGEIKAVLEDFNFASLHQLITPVVLFNEYDYFGKILIKTSGDNMEESLSNIENTWKSFYPNKPFEYHFLDDEYNELYKTEQRTASVLSIFSVITILVSCMGLFGLAVFMAGQRTKEVGIRKVLGASVAQVTALLSKDFLKLVIIAVLIASPIAWYAMHKWLQDFAYKINMPYGFCHCRCISPVNCFING